MLRNWITPELVVIVRSNPEESVLVTCKDATGHDPAGGPNPNVSDCYQSSQAGGQPTSNAWCRAVGQS